MSRRTRPSPMSSASDASLISTGPATCYGPSCSCHTVSFVGSTTPRSARVQLNPYKQRESIEPPSAKTSNDDLQQESDAPSNDASKQDFDFDDVFDYDHHERSSATGKDSNTGVVSISRQKSQAYFSFSHYAGHTKGAGSVKVARLKPARLRPCVTRIKSGCRQPDCIPCQELQP
jgi:hypothetical protein